MTTFENLYVRTARCLAGCSKIQKKEKEKEKDQRKTCTYCEMFGGL
jgi:hypothetical protein